MPALQVRLAVSAIALATLFRAFVVGDVRIPQRAGTGMGAPASFIAAVDTMKESRDMDMSCRGGWTLCLTDADIAEDVRTTVALGVTHVTVDTFYDHPAVMARWVRAVRLAGKHVWFRPTWISWEGSYGMAGTMTPARYIGATTTFIRAHRGLFRPGDILDPLPEPENSPYWARTSPFGNDWAWKNTPNATTDAYNSFFVDLTGAVLDALAASGVVGVRTDIRSVGAWFAAHPQTLYPATVARLGRLTVDMYPGQDPHVAPSHALEDLRSSVTGLEKLWGVPLTIGELGYTVAPRALVSDSQQDAVLKLQFAWLAAQPYVDGLNYWHGAGYPAPDIWNGASLFKGTTGAWTPRPAAFALSAMFAARVRPQTTARR